MYPTDRSYTREHEWVKIQEKTATIGITQFATKELGDIVFVELPDTGRTFNANDEVGTIESVKAVAEVYAPIDGEICALNTTLQDEPEILNDDPHGEGWIFRLQFSGKPDLTGLMNAKQYEDYIKSGEA